MKVLHVIQRYPPAVGGSETWCQEVARYLARAGDDVRVATLDVLAEDDYWKDPPWVECVDRVGRLDWDGGVLVRRYERSLPIPLLHRLFGALDRTLGLYFFGPHSLEMYARLSAEARWADVVHLHTVPYPHNFVGYLAARLHRRRVVITPHFHEGHPHYERRSNYWLLRHCDAVIAVTEYERDYLVARGIDPARVVVTGNGVHVEDYIATQLPAFKSRLFRRLGLPEGARVVSFIGRKAQYKGIATLVEAFRRLPAALDTALFLVGPSSEWYEQFCRQLGDRGPIIDFGVVPHAEKVNLLHLSDVLVLPSQFEAFGIVFLEAWACGIPVIGASRGAVPSVVGNAGLTFEHGDAGDLAAKLETLLTDRTLAKEMAHRGERRIEEKYTWERIADTTRMTYVAPRPAGMRILVCSNLFPPGVMGGAELIAQKQAKILRELGHEVRIFSGQLAGGGRTYQVEVEGDELPVTWVRLSPTDLNGDSWDFHNQAVAHEFAGLLERFNPDIVHFHNLVGLSSRLIDESHARGVPTVVTLHDYWGICFKNTMLKNDGRLCLKGGLDCLGCRETLIRPVALPTPVRNSHILLSLTKVDRFISPSQYLADRYAANGLPASKIAVIRNGLDLERFAPRPRAGGPALTLGFVGYLGRHKGIDLLLQALGFVRDIDRVRLLIVGEGEEAVNLRSRCRELGLDPYVTFHGRVDNQHIPEIYQRIDALAVPSIWPENSPVTITEAMASGIPVVAFDVGGIGELVDDGTTGLLAPPNDVRGLAERIERLADEPELRRRMGQRAREAIGRFEIRGQVERIVDLYRELRERPGRQPTGDLAVVLYHAADSWSGAVREMFRSLSDIEQQLGRRLLICRTDLADGEAFQAAKTLILFSGGNEARAKAVEALGRHVPILVPESAPDLKDLCVASNGGLFYADTGELAACLEFLLSDESLRQAIGVTGGTFAARRAV